MAITTLREVKGKPVARVRLGRMYFFKYIPSAPDDIYDMYPLVFVVRRRKNFFDGINYHHLGLKRRMFLYNKMVSFFSDNPLEEDTELLWRTFRKQLFNKRNLKAAEISFRQYRVMRVRSKLIEINPLDWERTLLISSELFKTATRKKLVSKPIWVMNERLIRSNK
tara:strand:- start:242 stop:739 length:498 start_codon:yes stop_codon:yes gene_type:complete